MPVLPRQLSVNQSSGNVHEDVVVVYVCPNPECGNYYGSSSMGDLEKEEVIAPNTARDRGSIRGHRNDCPNCKIPRRKRFARLVSIEEETEIRRSIRRPGRDAVMSPK